MNCGTIPKKKKMGFQVDFFTLLHSKLYGVFMAPAAKFETPSPRALAAWKATKKHCYSTSKLPNNTSHRQRMFEIASSGTEKIG